MLFGELNAHVALLGHGLKTVRVVDASLVEAPSSTQNRAGGRGSEMRQAKQGNHWHFGVKAPIGVDSQCGLTHSLATPLANVSEVATAHAVLHGWGDWVCGDGG